MEVRAAMAKKEEQLKEKEEAMLIARELAEKTYNDACDAIQGDEDVNKEAFQILPLLKDNLSLWKAEEEDKNRKCSVSFITH